jgi:hypothetical protein
MEAYASWLFYERRLLCLELYPDQPRAEDFVMAGNAGFGWHFPSGTYWKDMPQPSSRAAAVLDQVGVDWRTYPDRDFFNYEDSGFRPRLPASWPHVDAELLDAARGFIEADDFARAIPDENPNENPAWEENEERRTRFADLVTGVEARSLEGLRAKAEVMKRYISLSPDYSEPAAFASLEEYLAFSLAHDVLALLGRNGEA